MGLLGRGHNNLRHRRRRSENLIDLTPLIDTTVNIKADQNTKHEKVVQAMDVAKVFSIEKLGILHRR